MVSVGLTTDVRYNVVLVIVKRIRKCRLMRLRCVASKQA